MTGLFGEPWCITEEGLRTLVAIGTRDQFFAEAREHALAVRNGVPLKNTREVETRNGVAVVPVVGPMFRHADMLTEVSGATSYATLRKDLQTALDDPQVKAILLNIDSIGGEANGVSELANAIYRARGQKPLVAYVGGSGCSAAFWLASACDEIVAADTAALGSIGTACVYIDEKKKQEAAGEREIRIISSQSPYKNADPATDDGHARLQARVDAMTEVFVSSVARNRGVSEATVLEKFGQGDVMVGRRAVDAGLADRIGNFEDLLAEMVSAHQGETRMKFTMQTLKLSEDATEQQVQARVAALAQFEQQAFAASGATTAAEALGKMASGAEALRDLPGVRAELAKERADGIRRDLRATLEAGLDKKKLSLGGIQKAIPLVLRGDQKTAWVGAMSKLEAVTRDSVLEAACSVAIGPEDLAAIGEYAKSAAPVAAEPFREPERNPAKESAELDETGRKIKAAADEMRTMLDRNRASSK